MLIRAVEAAVWQCDGGWSEISHSGRSWQFTSSDYQHYRQRNALICNMSAVGHCGDSALPARASSVVVRHPICKSAATWPARETEIESVGQR